MFLIKIFFNHEFNDEFHDDFHDEFNLDIYDEIIKRLVP